MVSVLSIYTQAADHSKQASSLQIVAIFALHSESIIGHQI
jgi:hypothetical protein